MLKARVAFGLSKAKKTKSEEFEGKSVLLISETPEEKGQTYKFQLSKKASESLGVVRKDKNDAKQVAFAFPSFEEDETSSAVVANVTDLEEVDNSAACFVNMTGGFSSKPYFNAIKEMFEIGKEEAVFLLEDVSEEIGVPAFKLVKSSREEINGETDVQEESTSDEEVPGSSEDSKNEESTPEETVEGDGFSGIMVDNKPSF